MLHTPPTAEGEGGERHTSPWASSMQGIILRCACPSSPCTSTRHVSTIRPRNASDAISWPPAVRQLCGVCTWPRVSLQLETVVLVYLTAVLRLCCLLDHSDLTIDPLLLIG
eukprot:TRINITY_DN2969_c0_g2_i1.p3 TRINITY_DN2969_c0_g2~~TRINITY_DN2969_c0_g2_i1.p3  ORF type:complete len:111 (+),score=15.04 TRINITY_DN2969_c0_g2_i1:671-1003(+)